MTVSAWRRGHRSGQTQHFSPTTQFYLVLPPVLTSTTMMMSSRLQLRQRYTKTTFRMVSLLTYICVGHSHITDRIQCYISTVCVCLTDDGMFYSVAPDLWEGAPAATLPRHVYIRLCSSQCLRWRPQWQVTQHSNQLLWHLVFSVSENCFGAWILMDVLEYLSIYLFIL